MPATIIIGNAHLTPSNGKWLNNLGNTYPSLIEAYASVFAGRMTLLDLAHSIENYEITLDDFALENTKATLNHLRRNWMLTYLVLRPGGDPQTLHKVSLDRVRENISALKSMRATLSTTLYPQVAACLDEAIAQFEFLGEISHDAQFPLGKMILAGIPPVESERP